MNTIRVKQRLQQILKQRGVKGLIGLQQSFNDFDLDKNGSLSWEEFNFALQKSGLAPSPQDTRALFLEFDTDGSNEISYSEFLGALRGELSPKRRNIITRVFEGIDSDSDGVISMTDIGSCFNPKNHPDVVSGKSTVPVFLNDFFETFNTVTSNGYVSLQQFLEYYANAAAFEDDSTFETTMASVWNIPKNSQTNLNTKRQSLQSIAAGRSSSSSENTNDNRDSNEPPALTELRDQLISRGAKGIVGLSRKFRILDDDGSKSLNISEFKKGIKECGILMNENDLNRLFSYFDRDRSGTVDYEEFLKGVRGTMSPRRKQLVGMAFNKMDKTGNGYLDPEDVIDTYDASKHPDVLAGKKTADEVLREFLDTFDVGGEKDGKVTRNEFENYYSNVSASIDDDDYFELMIRNAWHISGGEGWSANTSNRRVLVTHADGRQTVEEIKDDMGLKANDTNGMISRLKAQGINASNISLHDGVGNKKKGFGDPSPTYKSQFKIA